MYESKRIDTEQEAQKYLVDPNLPFEEKLKKWRYNMTKCIRVNQNKYKLYSEMGKTVKLFRTWMKDDWDVYTKWDGYCISFYFIWMYKDITIVDNNGNKLLIKDMFVRMNVFTRELKFARRTISAEQYYSGYFHSHITGRGKLEDWTSEVCYGEINSKMNYLQVVASFDMYMSFLLSLLPNFLSSESSTTNPYRYIFKVNKDIGKYVERNVNPYIRTIRDNIGKVNLNILNTYGVLEVSLRIDNELIDLLKENHGDNLMVYKVGKQTYTHLYTNQEEKILTTVPVIKIRDQKYPFKIISVQGETEYTMHVDENLIERISSSINSYLLAYAEIKQDYSSLNDTGVLEQDEVFV